ncbi:hypothetical protein E2320_007413 [Naja naja]|nr:hypothetical protein E2320_007413 [Naja naja]
MSLLCLDRKQERELSTEMTKQAFFTVLVLLACCVALIQVVPCIRVVLRNKRKRCVNLNGDQGRRIKQVSLYDFFTRQLWKEEKSSKEVQAGFGEAASQILTGDT